MFVRKKLKLGEMDENVFPPPPDRHLAARNHRSGSVLVLAAAFLVMVFAFTAFTVDIGQIILAKQKCQGAADFAALAAVNVMAETNGLGSALQEAIDVATLNYPNSGTVLTNADVVFGVWDSVARSFAPTTKDPNAVMVTVRRGVSNDNAVQLMFAPVLGHQRADVFAQSIASLPTSGENSFHFNFTVDEEMIDSDIPSIESLASQYGVSSESLISDSNGDGWINLPADVEIEVPTGQVGDPAIMDVTAWGSAFPFRESTQYTLLDFLATGTELADELNTTKLEEIEWQSWNAPHPELDGKKVLDPVPGVAPLEDHDTILNIPDDDVVYVAPVYKSDAGMAETDPSKYGAPAANMLGERRGLLAFKIIAARENPAGGSELPLITIKVVDPDTVNLEDVSLDVPAGGNGGSTSSGGASLVR